MKKLIRSLTSSLAILPSLALADLAPPIRRVQRIGYEVLGDKTSTGLIAMLVLLAFVGALALLLIKKDVVRKMANVIKMFHANRPILFAISRDYVISGVVLGMLLLMAECDVFGPYWLFEVLVSWGLVWVLFVVLTIVVVLMRLLLRRAIHWGVLMTEVCVSIAMIGGILGSIFMMLMRETSSFGSHENNPGWKYPEEISKAERTAIESRIASVKDELQLRFDLEYAKLNTAGKLKKIGLFRGGYEYRYARAKREMSEENALAVVKSILELDERLRLCCDGVPIEWLASAMKCPDPSIDDESIKNAFRDWAMRQMPAGLNGVEREIVFDWQFACSEAEKRPWRTVFNKPQGDLAHNVRISQFVDEDRKRGYSGWLTEAPAENGTERGFEDFSVRLSASEYVLKWAANAARVQYPFRNYDTLLVDKARNPGRDFGRLGIVGFKYDRNVTRGYWSLEENKEIKISTAELAFRGQVHRSDINCAADYCRQLRESNNWICELAELRFEACTPETARNVFGALSGWKIQDCVYFTGGEDAAGPKWLIGERTHTAGRKADAMDVSRIQNLEVEKVSFFNVNVRGFGGSFSAPAVKDLRFESCEIADMSFVAGLPNVRDVTVVDSTVANCSDLSGLKKLSNVRFIKSRGPVSLDFLKGNGAVSTLMVQGSQVTHADVIGTCAKLSSLDISGCSWDDNDWLTAVKGCRHDIYVTYDEKCIPNDLVIPFKRVLRAKRPRADRSPEKALNEAINDNDVEEVLRLLEAGVPAQKCMDALVGNSFFGLSGRLSTTVKSVDAQILQALLDHGAHIGRLRNGESVLNNIWSGESRSRLKLVEILLSQGCDPNERHGSWKRVVLDDVLNFYRHGECTAECVGIVKLLLEHGADPNLMVDGYQQLGCPRINGSKSWDVANEAMIILLLNEHGMKKSKFDVTGSLKRLFGHNPAQLKRILENTPTQKE